MQIFKFGGASVKDANGVKNIHEVLKKTGLDNKVIIVSAMGKTTNALEKVVHSYFNDKTALAASIQECELFHHNIASGLFPKGHQVFEKMQELFAELKGFLAWNKSPQYDFVYDQIVCYGELLSTTIIHLFLNENGVKTTWLDARDLLKTDTSNRDATVLWDQTQNNIKSIVTNNKTYITQGFIASDENNFTTTLGREGSDYTGAIFAYCLGADSLTIWKDVPGVLNGDPRVFENTQLLHCLLYTSPSPRDRQKSRMPSSA